MRKMPPPLKGKAPAGHHIAGAEAAACS